jgi:hypothetical protein
MEVFYEISPLSLAAIERNVAVLTEKPHQFHYEIFQLEKTLNLI